ncbi:MAG: PAS domain S-box protein [Spirochaetales bacterium]|nr:PAS domain S-box protein [Spirochaetales bacterium]
MKKKEEDIILSSPIIGYARHKIVLDEGGKAVDYIFVEINKTFEEFTGLEASAVLKHKVTEVLPRIGESEFDWIGFYGEVALGGGNRDFEQYSRPLDRWYRVFAFSSEYLYFSTIFVDITESKSGEKINISSKRDYLSLINNIPGIVYRCKYDELWTMVFLSSNCYKIFGYEHTELLSNSLIAYSEIILEEDRSIVKLKIDQAISANRSWEIEYRVRKKSGQIIWVYEKGSAVFDVNGDIIFLDGFIFDVSEKKSYEQELVLMHAAINQSSETVVITDVDGNIKYANPAFVKTTGYQVNEVIGKNPRILKSGETDVSEYSRLWKIISRGETWHGEFHNKRKDGSLYWERASISPILDIKGNITDYIAIKEDITDLKEQELQIDYQSRLQSILINLASEYINAPLDKLDEIINRSLAEIGRFVESDRSYIFKYDWEKDICNNTYEWCREGIEPQIDELQGIPNEFVKWWVDAHKTGKTLYVEDVFDLSEDDGVRQVLEPQGVKSLMTIPMFSCGECIGFLGFDSVVHYHDYTEKEEMLLKIFSEMIVNVENRIMAEEKVVLNESRFRALEDNSESITQIIGIDGKALYVSQQINQILGYSPEEMIGMESTLSLIHDDDLPMIKQKLAKILVSSGRRDKVFYRYMHKDGHWVWLEATGCNLVDHPLVGGVFLTIRDVTEQKRIEAEIVETLKETETMNKFMVGREGQILDLKHEVNLLLKELGRDVKYKSAEGGF